MNFTKNKQIILLVSFGMMLSITVFALIFLIIGGVNVSPKNNPTKLTPLTPAPPENTTDFDKNYSNLNYLEPGKSTLEDVIRLNGEPDSSKNVSGGKLYLYTTPNTSLFNEVFVKGGVVEYTTEHVFTDNRGDYNSYVDAFGSPDLESYSNNPTSGWLVWSVFLDDGIAIENNERDIARILYFIPQNQNDFLDRFTNILKLSRTPPSPVFIDIIPIEGAETTPAPE